MKRYNIFTIENTGEYTDDFFDNLFLQIKELVDKEICLGTDYSKALGQNTIELRNVTHSVTNIRKSSNKIILTITMLDTTLVKYSAFNAKFVSIIHNKDYESYTRKIFFGDFFQVALLLTDLDEEMKWTKSLKKYLKNKNGTITSTGDKE